MRAFKISATPTFTPAEGFEQETVPFPWVADSGFALFRAIWRGVPIVAGVLLVLVASFRSAMAAPSSPLCKPGR